MAEGLGLAASVIAVVGLAGQVVQGCQNIKGWIGDFQNAPKSIQNLMLELNAIEESAKAAEALGKASTSGSGEQLAPALRLCFDAVDKMRKKIVDADGVFKDQLLGKRARGWHRLKVVFGKQGTLAAVDRLSRAKAQLLVAQSNALLHLSQSQVKQLKGIDEVLSLGLRTTQNSAAVLNGVKETAREMHSQVVDAATVVNSLSADMRRFIDDARQNCITTDMVAEVEKATKEVLQKHALQTYQMSSKAQRGSYVSVNTSERDTPHRGFAEAGRRPHYLSKREILCHNTLVTISKTSFHASMQFEEIGEENGSEATKETGPSYRSIITFEVSVDLGLWRRGLRAVIADARKSYTPGLDFRLRTYNIVEDSAPVFQAAEALDIQTMRSLFASGCASPFDHSTNGASLFHVTFFRLCHSRQLEESIRGLRLLNFILSHGGTPESLAHKKDLGNFPWIEVVMEKSGTQPEVMQIIEDAVRLLFQTSSQDPLANWNVGICMTLPSQGTPIAELIRQQEQWPVELGVISQPDTKHAFDVCENDRQIFEDEHGYQMALLLAGSRNYAAINPLLRGWTRTFGIHSVLKLYSESDFKGKIHTGCRNRITILLRGGYDPRGLQVCTVIQANGPWGRNSKCDPRMNPEIDCELSVSEYARYTKTLDLWQEALKYHGWSKDQIDDLLEEESYLGIPKLFSGELTFRTQAQNREEFLHMISVGGFAKTRWDAVLPLSTFINMQAHDLAYTINEAYKAFQMKSTPGSWQGGEGLRLELGADIFLWGLMWETILDWKSFASFEEYDKRYDFRNL